LGVIHSNVSLRRDSVKRSPFDEFSFHFHSLLVDSDKGELKDELNKDKIQQTKTRPKEMPSRAKVYSLQLQLSIF
jgi:hypothetical protein